MAELVGNRLRGARRVVGHECQPHPGLPRSGQRVSGAGHRRCADVDHTVEVKQGDVIPFDEWAIAAGGRRPGRGDAGPAGPTGFGVACPWVRGTASARARPANRDPGSANRGPRPVGCVVGEAAGHRCAARAARAPRSAVP